MSLLRSLHSQDPVLFSTEKLAKRFRVSPEGVRRVLRGKWRMEEGRKRELEERVEEGERKKEREAKVAAEEDVKATRGASPQATRVASAAPTPKPQVPPKSMLGAALVEPPPRRLRPPRAARPRSDL